MHRVRCPTALEWELFIGVVDALSGDASVSEMAIGQYIVILIVVYLKVRRWHFTVWCRSVSSVLMYIYVSAKYDSEVVAVLFLCEYAWPSFGEGDAEMSHVAGEGDVVVAEESVGEDGISSNADSGGLLEPPTSDSDSGPPCFNSVADPMAVDESADAVEPGVGVDVGNAEAPVGGLRRSRRLAEAAGRRASVVEVEVQEDVGRRVRRGVRGGRRGHGGRRGRGRGSGSGGGDHLDADVWKRFSPEEVDEFKCLARIWNGGRGGQCGHPRERGSDFCCRREHAEGGQFGSVR